MTTPETTVAELDGKSRLRAWLSTIHTGRGGLVAASLVCAAITTIFFFPIFRGQTCLDVASQRKELYTGAYKSTPIPRTLHYDQVYSFYPWQVFMSKSLRSGELPLWNPHSFAGQPFFANGQNGVLYPPRVLLSLIVSPQRVHDLLLLSHMLLGGIFMYLLLAEVGLSFPSAVFGAVAWMLNSFMLTWMALEHFIVVEAWLPLIILLSHRAMMKKSWIASAANGTVLAVVFLGGNLIFVEIVFVIWGSHLAYLFARQAWGWTRGNDRQILLREVLRCAGLIALPLVVCLGLIAVQLLPTLELINSIERRPLNYAEYLSFKFNLSDLIYFFIEPDLTISTPEGDFIDPYHKLLFLGTPTALLALIGFWRKHPMVSYARALALVTLAIAVGTPVTWLAFKLLPGFAHLKPLARALFPFNFAVAILAAFGLEALLRHRLKVWRLRLKIPWPYALACLLLAVVVAQMYLFGKKVIRYQPNDPDYLFPETPLIQNLKKDKEIRFLPISPALMGSMSMVFDLDNAGGYDSLIPQRIVRLWRVVSGEDSEVVFQRPLSTAFTVWETQQLRLDLFPRLAISNVVTQPYAPLPSDKKGSTDFAALTVKFDVSKEGMIPLVGDWNGDDIDTVGSYDPKTGTFHLRDSNTEGPDHHSFQYGPAGADWLPVAGDWNGDGTDTVGLYDPVARTCHVRNTNASGPDDLSVTFATAAITCIPLVGDWNGTGIDSIGLYDPATAQFDLRGPDMKNSNDLVFIYGTGGDRWRPVVGDWNADGIDTIGLYDVRSGTFHLRDSNKMGAADAIFPYGPPGGNFNPLAGRWTEREAGIQAASVGLFDQETNNFYLGSSSVLQSVYRGSDGDIYQVINSLPRAHLVYGCERVDSPLMALQRFTDPAFDPSRAVIIESDYFPQTVAPCTPDQRANPEGRPEKAEIIGRSLNTLALRVEAARDGWLVVNESYDPGWKATVDGKPVTVLPGNYAFRALPIPAGEHLVEMRYQPASFRIGMVISLSMLIAIVLMAISTTKRLRVWRPATRGGG
ncbi:MAG: YfhO family protein [Acidobacteriota bacterium]